MNKKLIEYLIIVTVIVLLLYGCFTLAGYDFQVKKANVTDSINMFYPTSSGYTVNGDTVEFRNVLYNFYDMDVSKLNSSNPKVTNLLSHFSNVGHGTIDFLNESCCVVTMEFDDGSGFRYHSLIIPIDSFTKSNMSFKKDATVYVFEANDRQFALDTAFNSQVVL
ncbi:hypothetical protein [uncultured Methanobrevibacter sp.]|uniref:hypothetical protein n=1 Tax=uncultured Methanobrevibacter sp. TaxID=253161 RepID=UPI0025D81B02|nr:hypothetical protein [uncultured Methanobrevibacter sp.]